jgi:DNA-binding transcriptional LysR family regulator
MELYQLRSFLKIAQIKNLTRAASQINMSQSALSNQVKLLEDELGVKLFERTPKGMYLTEHGRILHTHAQETLTQADIFLEKARELNGQATTTVKIGLNTDGAFLKVSRLNRLLTSTFPRTHFVLVSSQTIRTAEMLHQGLIDIGFFFGNTSDPDITSEVISRFNVRIVIPSEYISTGSSLDLPALAGLPWIWSVCDCPYYQVVQAEMDTMGLVPNTVVDAMDESVVKELVLDGQGIAILRQDDAEEVAAKGDVHIWEGAKFPMDLRLGILRSNKKSSLLQAVTEQIKTVWGAEKN